MLHKHSFIPVFSCLLSGLAWWSVHVQALPEVNVAHLGIESNHRRQISSHRDLVEALDRLVSYEHYYHSVYKRFTKLMDRTGFALPRHLTEVYDVRISEASSDHLVINAFSEIGGKVQDLVSIDQDYLIHANFEIPPPRVDYLKEQAIKYLRLLRQGSSAKSPAEGGVFRGFFRYTVQTDSKNERIVQAVGIRFPVKNLRVELSENENLLTENPEAFFLSDLLKETADSFVNPQVGQQSDSNPGRIEEEAYLAQKIFLGEMGRYAKSWSELSRVAHFRFEGKDPYAPAGGISRGVSESSRSLIMQTVNSENGEAQRMISSQSGKKALEIEPIKSDE